MNVPSNQVPMILMPVVAARATVLVALFDHYFGVVMVMVFVVTGFVKVMVVLMVPRWSGVGVDGTPRDDQQSRNEAKSKKVSLKVSKQHDDLLKLL